MGKAGPTMEDIINSGPTTVVSSLVMGIIAAVAVIFRFMAKRETTFGITVDDGWITLSLAAYWAYAGVMIWSVYGGGGGLDMRNFVHGNRAGITRYLQVRWTKDKQQSRK